MFPSGPGTNLSQEVYFNLTDDLIALENVELVTVTLNIVTGTGVSLGEPHTTTLNIQDNDGTYKCAFVRGVDSF